MVLRERHWTHETEVFRRYFLSVGICRGNEQNRIKTHKRSKQQQQTKNKPKTNQKTNKQKTTRLIMTKHNMRIFWGYAPFSSCKATVKRWKMRCRILICFWLSCFVVLFRCPVILERGLTLKIGVLCFVIVNSALFNIAFGSCFRTQQSCCCCCLYCCCCCCCCCCCWTDELVFR